MEKEPQEARSTLIFYFCFLSFMIIFNFKSSVCMKLLGENVEPSELEEAAMRSSLIQQIIVVGQVRGSKS